MPQLIFEVRPRETLIAELDAMLNEDAPQASRIGAHLKGRHKQKRKPIAGTCVFKLLRLSVAREVAAEQLRDLVECRSTFQRSRWSLLPPSMSRERKSILESAQLHQEQGHAPEQVPGTVAMGRYGFLTQGCERLRDIEALVGLHSHRSVHVYAACFRLT